MVQNGVWVKKKSIMVLLYVVELNDILYSVKAFPGTLLLGGIAFYTPVKIVYDALH